MFTSWRSSLSGLTSGLVGVLFLTDLITGGVAITALSITQAIIGIVVPDEKKMMEKLNEPR